MNQSKKEKRLVDYVFEELPGNKMKDFEERLKKDPELRRQYEEFRDVLEETRNLHVYDQIPSLSPEVSQRILAAARQQAQLFRERKGFSWNFGTILHWPSFGFALSLVLVAGLGFWVGQERTLRSVASQNEGKLLSMNDTIELLEEVKAVKKLAAQESAPSANPAVRVRIFSSAPNRSEVNPTSVSNQFEIAQNHTRDQQWGSALQNYQAITTLAPQTYESMLAHHQSARIYVKMGDLPKALGYYETLLANYPDYEHRDQVLLESGRVYAKQKQWDKALDRLQRVYDDYPSMRNQVTPHLYYVKQNLMPDSQDLGEDFVEDNLE